VTAARNPFPGPRPYELGDADVFFGRTAETRELRSLIASHGVVVVVGQSGCGKSSLLRAGVIPELVRRDYEVLPVARLGAAARTYPPGLGGEVSVYERNVVSYLGGTGPGPRPLLDTLAWRDRLTAVDGTRMPRVLVIDQFEELFTTYPDAWRDRAGLVNAVLAANRGTEDLRVVLVMRAEYLSSFAALVSRLDDHASARDRAVYYFHVERLSQEAATDVIASAFSRSYPDFRREGAARLARQMSREFVRKPDGTRAEAEGEFVEPLYLQLICRGLWDKLARGALSPAAETLIPDADIERDLRSFVQQEIAAVSQETRVQAPRILKWLDETLITSAGTRGSVIRESTASAGMPNAVVEALERRHLLRSEERAAAQWYELAHDRLVAGVKGLRAELRQQSDQRFERAIRVTSAVLVLALVGKAFWDARTSRSAGAAAGSVARATAERAAEVAYTKPDLAAEVIQEALSLGSDPVTDSIAREVAARTLTSRVVHTVARRPVVASNAANDSLVAVGMEDGRVMVLNVLHVPDGGVAPNEARRDSTIRSFEADVRGVVPGWKGGVVGLAYASEGRRLAVSAMAGRVALIAGPDWRPDAEIMLDDEISAVTVTPRGDEVGVGTPGGELRRLPRRATPAQPVRDSDVFDPLDLFGVRMPEVPTIMTRDDQAEGVDRRVRPRRITDLAYTPGGDLLAVEANGAVQLWRRNSDSAARVWRPPGRPRRDVGTLPARMAVAPDGSGLVVAAGDSLHLLRFADGEVAQTGTIHCAVPTGQRATALAYTRDGATLLVATDGGTVSAWDPASATCRWSAASGASRITAIVPLATGGRVVTTSENQEVRLWSPPPSTREVQREVEGWRRRASAR